MHVDHDTSRGPLEQSEYIFNNLNSSNKPITTSSSWLAKQVQNNRTGYPCKNVIQHSKCAALLVIGYNYMM